MEKKDIIAKAKEFGIDSVYFIAPEKYDISKSVIDRLKGDPNEIMPGVKCLIALVKSYQPYQERDCQPYVSASYIASHSSYIAAKKLVDELREKGIKAEMGQDLPVKSILGAAGIAKMGKNSLAAIDGFGTRFVAQIIAADNFEPEKYDCGLECCDCGLCESVCPMRAIDASGLTPRKCMRFEMSGQVMPQDVKRHINSILGCELCQNVCPSNNGISHTEMPHEIAELLTFDSLLIEYSNKKAEIANVVGKNMMTQGRLRAQALCLAAKQKNADYIDVACAIKDEGTPCEIDAAIWYLRNFEKSV